jgi:hypothetical protein
MLREGATAEPARRPKLALDGHGLTIIGGGDVKITGATCACGWSRSINPNTTLTRNEDRKTQLKRKHHRHLQRMLDPEMDAHLGERR